MRGRSRQLGAKALRRSNVMAIMSDVRGFTSTRRNTFIPGFRGWTFAVAAIVIAFITGIGKEAKAVKFGEAYADSASSGRGYYNV
jgi:hypothetical protein